jgi:hypothetical protein
MRRCLGAKLKLFFRRKWPSALEPVREHIQFLESFVVTGGGLILLEWRHDLSQFRVWKAPTKGPPIDPHSYDAGKKIRRKKRHIVVDTQGLLMRAIVHAADIQDRDGGVLLMATYSASIPFS